MLVPRHNWLINSPSLSGAQSSYQLNKSKAITMYPASAWRNPRLTASFSSLFIVPLNAGKKGNIFFLADCQMGKIVCLGLPRTKRRIILRIPIQLSLHWIPHVSKHIKFQKGPYLFPFRMFVIAGLDVTSPFMETQWIWADVPQHGGVNKHRLLYTSHLIISENSILAPTFTRSRQIFLSANQHVLTESP